MTTDENEQKVNEEAQAMLPVILDDLAERLHSETESGFTLKSSEDTDELEGGYDAPLHGFDPLWKMRLRYLAGWVLVRPRRAFVGACFRGAYLSGFRRELVWDGKTKKLVKGWRRTNLHLWLVRKAIFEPMKRFAKTPTWKAHPSGDWKLRTQRWWVRPFGWAWEWANAWTDIREHFECYHCGSEEGAQGDLTEYSDTFKNVRSWTSSTMDGNDYRFCGTTICPKCGYEDYYEDGSL